jgi:hypothetical protein
MGQPTKATRENRTITVDFHNEATYGQLLDAPKAFVEFVLAFLLALGFQLKHKATCRGGGCLTRQAHSLRLRLGGITIWRVQCTTCRAVFTVLPHFVLRYRQMRPEVARDALVATHGFPIVLAKFTLPRNYTFFHNELWRCLGKPSFDETPDKSLGKASTPGKNLSDCRLTKHRLINSLGAKVNETGQECMHGAMPLSVA